MNIEAINKVKEAIIDKYRNIGDKRALLTKGGVSYTGQEIANEIENETEFGVSMIESLIKLTIELLSREVIKSDI